MKNDKIQISSQSEKSGEPMREQKYSHWRKQLTDIQGERKRVDYGLKRKVSTVDIRIMKSGLKFIHSKVFSSGLIFKEYFCRSSISFFLKIFYEEDLKIKPELKIADFLIKI